MRTTVDFAVVKHTTLQMVGSVVIEDHPPRENSRNFHSHLILLLRCSSPAEVLGGDPTLPEHYRWMSGSELVWKEHTSTAGFVDGLNNIIADNTLEADELNLQVENYLLE